MKDRQKDCPNLHGFDLKISFIVYKVDFSCKINQTSPNILRKFWPGLSIMACSCRLCSSINFILWSNHLFLRFISPVSILNDMPRVQKTYATGLHRSKRAITNSCDEFCLNFFFHSHIMNFDYSNICYIHVRIVYHKCQYFS